MSETQSHKRWSKRWRCILRLTSWVSFRVRSYTSSNPTLSLCESNAIDNVKSASTKVQRHTTNAIINQHTTTEQHPNHRDSLHKRNNPSEGKSQLLHQTTHKNWPTPKFPTKPPNAPYSTPYIQKVRNFKDVNGDRFKEYSLDIKVRCQRFQHHHQPAHQGKSTPKLPRKSTSTKQPLRRKKPTAKSTSLQKQKSIQVTPKSPLPHIPYQIYQTTVVSKWRVDGEFKVWQRDREGGILLYPTERSQSQTKNTTPQIHF